MQSRHPGITMYPTIDDANWFVEFYLSQGAFAKFKATDIFEQLNEQYLLNYTNLYADNIVYATGLSFFVKGGEWSEFENSPLFQDLISFVESAHRERQDTSTVHHAQEYATENPQLFEHCSFRVFRKLLSALTCKGFHRT